MCCASSRAIWPAVMGRIPEPPQIPAEPPFRPAGRCRRCGWLIWRGERCYRLSGGLICEDCAAEVLRACRVTAGDA